MKQVISAAIAAIFAAVTFNVAAAQEAGTAPMDTPKVEKKVKKAKKAKKAKSRKAAAAPAAAPADMPK